MKIGFVYPWASHMDSFLFSVFWNCSSSSSWHLPLAGDSQTPLTVASDVAALAVADLHRKALHQSCMYPASFLSGLLSCRLSTTSYRSIGCCGASWWQNIKSPLYVEYGKLPSCPIAGPLVLLCFFKAIFYSYIDNAHESLQDGDELFYKVQALGFETYYLKWFLSWGITNYDKLPILSTCCHHPCCFCSSMFGWA